MKRLLPYVFATCLLVATFATAVTADIPPLIDYHVRYHKIGGIPTWEYMPGSDEYGLPTWGQDADRRWWHIPNHWMPPEYEKDVYFEVEWEPGMQPGMPGWRSFSANHEHFRNAAGILHGVRDHPPRRRHASCH